MTPGLDGYARAVIDSLARSGIAATRTDGTNLVTLSGTGTDKANWTVTVEDSKAHGILGTVAVTAPDGQEENYDNTTFSEGMERIVALFGQPRPNA
jgi:hypothetical protein